MKRTAFRRILSLCLLLLLCAQALPVMAAGENIFTLETRYAENGVYAFQPPAVDFSESHLYYDQLTEDNQRLIYEAIANATPANNALKIDLTELPDFSFPADGITDAFLAKLYAYLGDVVLPAYGAASLDKPELFWQNSVKYGGSFSYNNQGITVIHLDVTIVPMAHFDPSSYEKTAAELANKLESLSFDTTQGTYSLLKQFHDYLCESTVYINSANAHNIIGPLLDGESVCEGYAEAFKLFCDQYGIPCMIITGVGVTTNGTEAHAWNAVRMEDGKWYCVDVTWDDQASKIYYDFFLVGGTTVPKHFQALAFSDSHQVRNDVFQNGTVVFASPVLNDTAYDPAASHVHEYDAFVTEPTCTEGGYTTYTCACGDSYTGDKTDPLGHDYAESVTEPTCTEGGYTTYTCACGDSYVDDETDPLGHDFCDWALTEPGVETRTCSRCDETETREATPVYDQDGDGRITESDAEMLMDLLVSGADADNLQYDIDFDGELTIYDCILILQQID